MLSETELERMVAAATAAFKVPFVDDIEDFVWETIWAHAKRLPAPPRVRTKRLFDVVDPAHQIGWSAKTLKWSLTSPSCEFVIQRADVFDKREVLGFPDLSANSNPQDIGDAVVAHWTNKIRADMAYQGVHHARLALLLKSNDRTVLMPVEEDLEIPAAGEITWAWRDDNHRGLLGHRDGQLVYRWYRNQKQLFEVVRLPEDAQLVEIPTTELSVGELIQRLGG